MSSNTGVILLGILVYFNFGCFCQVEVFSGAYIERLPTSILYEATSPILFRINHKVDNIHCENYTITCLLIRNLLTDLQSLSMKSSVKDRGTLLNDDGESGTYTELTKSHIKRLFTDQAEISSLTNFAKSRNFSITNVTLVPLEGRKNDYAAKLGTLLKLATKIKLLITMCQIKKLRPDVLPLQVLQLELEKFQHYWSKGGYTRSVSEANEYYNLPLIECVMTDSTTLIGMHIPLIQTKSKGVKLFKIVTPSFSWNDVTCSIQLAVTDVALDKPDDPKFILIPSCDPSKAQLCRISNPTGNHLKSILCAQRVLRGGTIKQIATACPLTCEQTGQEVQYVTKLPSNTYLVNPLSSNTTVICKNRTIPLALVEVIGTTKIQLPCDCYVNNINHGILTGGQGCRGSDSLKTNQVIPAAWSSISSLKISPYNEPKPVFDHLDDCLDRRWMKNYASKQDHTPTWYIITTSLTMLGIVLILAVTIYTCIQYHQIAKRVEELTNRIPTNPNIRRLTLPDTPRPSSSNTYNEPDLRRELAELTLKKKIATPIASTDEYVNIPTPVSSDDGYLEMSYLEPRHGTNVK